MRRFLQIAAVSTLLLAAASTARAQITFGIRIGEPPAPRASHVGRQPGPDYDWVDGYWYPDGSRYKWHDGYWTRPPYAGAYWVAPYHVGGQYFAGRWEGQRGNITHDHHWDRGQQRDDRRGPSDRDDRRGPGDRDDRRR